MTIERVENRVAENERDIKALQKDLSERLISRVTDNERDVRVIQKESEMQNRLFVKLEETVVKIQDLTESMHRLITIHDERIRVQEKSLDLYRIEMKNEIKEIEDRTTAGQNMLSIKIEAVETKIEAVELKILARLEQMQQRWESSDSQKKASITEKISAIMLKIEAWKWFFMGIIFVSGLVAGHNDFLSGIIHFFIKVP